MYLYIYKQLPKKRRLNGYFSNGVFYNNVNKTFGSLYYIDILPSDAYTKLSIDNQMDDLSISNDHGVQEMIPAISAARNNIIYSQQIISLINNRSQAVRI